MFREASTRGDDDATLYLSKCLLESKDVSEGDASRSRSAMERLIEKDHVGACVWRLLDKLDVEGDVESARKIVLDLFRLEPGVCLMGVLRLLMEL